MTNGQTPPPRRGGMGWLWIVLIVVIGAVLVWWWWPTGDADLDEGEVFEDDVGMVDDFQGVGTLEAIEVPPLRIG